MLKVELERTATKYLAYGSLLVTIFLLTSTNNDPVNVTKLFVLGGVAIPLLGLSVGFAGKYLFINFRSALIVLILFIFALVNSMLFSKAPFTQNFYGASGRNTGVLTYIFLAIVLLAALIVRTSNSFKKCIYALIAAGVINVVYCGWVLTFGDFIGWNNPYGNILGLFGNPDFISAFLGIFIAASTSFMVSSETHKYIRMILLALVPLSFYEILKSHAIQGVIVTAGGFLIVGFFVARSKFSQKIYSNMYAFLSFLLGVAAVFGTLQKGPLSFLYKRSVSLRGSYWRAGVEMGNSHPVAGVGMDTYGDWYRSARPPVALIDTPGVNTLSNVSHNVVIDLYASGGVPLLLSYLGILVLGAIAILRVLRRDRKYDRIFVGLTSVWLCYETQSIISINQIGLAIWGWLFTGLLISYEFISREPKTTISRIADQKKASKIISKGSSVISPQLIAGIGVIVGLLISCPPMSADAKWFSATRSHDLTKIEAALLPSYLNPADSYKYAQAVNLFQTNNLPDLAHKYAKIAVDFNPDYFNAWKELYFLPASTESEKSEALRNMKRLDPKNPDVTAN